MPSCGGPVYTTKHFIKVLGTKLGFRSQNPKFHHSRAALGMLPHIVSWIKVTIHPQAPTSLLAEGLNRGQQQKHTIH